MYYWGYLLDETYLREHYIELGGWSAGWNTVLQVDAIHTYIEPALFLTVL